jgi:predicted hotdog family 3-hydroxylacyl-ACP dehydratase
MIISKEHIESLIPQRPPFVMIDELIYADENVTRTKLQVREENIFVENGRLREAGLLENIAQTAAARAGYAAKKENGPVRVGYIGAVKNFEVFNLPEISDTLETEIIITNQVFDVTVINGSIKCNNKLLAQCEMKIFIINHKKP